MKRITGLAILILLWVIFMCDVHAQQRRKQKLPTQSTSTPQKASGQSNQQTATTKDGKIVILKDDGTWEYLKESPRKDPSPPEQKEDQSNQIAEQVVVKPTMYPKMTYSELCTFWKDQKIIILPFYDRISVDYPRVRRYSESEGFSKVGVIAEREFLKSYRNDRLPSSQYTGKTGKIIDARDRKIKRDNESEDEIVELLIALEGTEEKIVIWLVAYDSHNSVGFLAEMEIAKSYIGRCVWNRFNNFKTSDTEMGWPSGLDRPTQKLLVSRVEWKTQPYGPSFKVWVKTDDGIEGYLDTGGNCFDNRFHLGGKPYFTDSDYFYLEDPRKKFPGWPRAVWDSILREEVAIGMTLEMVRLACPRQGIERIGAVISLTDSSDSGVVYRACGKKFLAVTNKVIKYFE